MESKLKKVIHICRGAEENLQELTLKKQVVVVVAVPVSVVA